MSEPFGERAAQLAGLAARALGWRPEEFWVATPADLALSLADPTAPASGLTRTEFSQLMERESNGR